MSKNEIITTSNLRSNLKKAFESELSHLPDLLEQLEPKDRLNFICKIMPYVFAKMETVHFKEGEEFSIYD